MSDIQKRYTAFYQKVQDELAKDKIIKKSLMEICSVYLDRKGHENQVNVEILLESKAPQRIKAKKLFDKYCKDFGFTMNYINLIGDLPSEWTD